MDTECQAETKVTVQVAHCWLSASALLARRWCSQWGAQFWPSLRQLSFSSGDWQRYRVLTYTASLGSALAACNIDQVSHSSEHRKLCLQGLLLLTFVAGAGAGLLGWRAFMNGGLLKPEEAAGKFKPVAEISWEEREDKVARDIDEVARLQRKELSDFDRRLEARERNKYFEL